MSYFEKIETENNFSSSLTGEYRGQSFTSLYLLGQRESYPTAEVLTDICQFNPQRPSGAPDNYRIYTPSADDYGIQVVSASANDTLLGTGVRQVKVYYLDFGWSLNSVVVDMNGTTAVTAVASGVRRILDFFSVSTGSLSVSDGDITLETIETVVESPWTGRQTLGLIKQGGNKDLTAIFTVPSGKTLFAKFINVSSSNQDQSVRLISNTDPITRELLPANCFLFQSIDLIGSNNNASQELYDLKFPSQADVKISASPVNTTADSSCHLVMALIDTPIIGG